MSDLGSNKVFVAVSPVGKSLSTGCYAGAYTASIMPCTLDSGPTMQDYNRKNR